MMIRARAIQRRLSLYSNQTLANSRVQEAIARVGVWRSLLAVASVHGDLKPFLLEIDRVQKGL